ncbi:MAG: AraC family transcriptional regulator [Ruminococcaceae bacterium]|nr:AraC family transcriptional regulator [Oscillospiraceae bacterium]
MNLYHLKRTDNAEQIRISTPLGLESVEDCRFLLVGDADVDPSAPLHISHFGYEAWLPDKKLEKISSRYMLRYVQEGKGIYCGVPISKGYAYLTVPGVEYSITSDAEDPLKHFWVTFEGSAATETMREVFGRVVPFAEYFSNADQAISVIEEIVCGRFGKVNEHYLHISAFYRLLALHSALPRPPANIHHYDFSVYLKAMDYIEYEYNEGITVSEIAKRIHIVPSYLYRIFIKYSGISPQQALMQKRMQMATILLDQHIYTVGQVAEMVGYSDALLFSKIFKKHYGVSPTQYQKEH